VGETDMIDLKANKIFTEEILPLVTKAFSSITAELAQHHGCLKDENETFKEFYESKAEMFASDFKNYAEGTAKLQYEFLTGREKQSEITDYSSNE
jgi:hypothetical protein